MAVAGDGLAQADGFAGGEAGSQAEYGALAAAGKVAASRRKRHWRSPQDRPANGENLE